MDAEQGCRANPFGMDESCTNCEELSATRTNVVHGYGDVGGDFLVIGETPSATADREGVPFVGDAERSVLDVLAGVGLCGDPDATPPELDNTFLTYLARCRHHDRPATDDEVATCEPFLNGEVRMINPEIIVPVGQRALGELAFEYTTYDREALDVADSHAETIRGRGFEIVPSVGPDALDDERADALGAELAATLGRDYRQTKGRRSR